MTNRKTPRVASIGLDDSELESITPLCGEVRPAESLDDYLLSYSWTETDIVVLRGGLEQVDCSVNLMTVGPAIVTWSDTYAFYSTRRHYQARSDIQNTARELAVAAGCPDWYKSLASELSSS